MRQPAGRPQACTVVVPVRNDAVHLRRFLAALEQQSRLPDEVVVVDNGSSDNTAQVARNWGARVVEESRIGIPFAAAAGYNAAAGNVIVRADADTLPRTDWIQSLLAHLDHNLDAVAVSGPGWFHELPWLLGGVASSLYIGTYVCATGLALGHTPLFGTNLAFRKSWWDEVKDEVHLDAAVHDDMDLSFRVRPRDRVVFAWNIGVGMSARPLKTMASLRVSRGFETIQANWRDERPWERWAKRRSPE